MSLETAFQQKLDKLDDYNGNDLLYENDFIQQYLKTNDEANYASQGEELAKVICPKFSSFIRSINHFKNTVFQKYPNAYNQALWGEHDGCYSEIFTSDNKNRTSSSVNIQREKNIAKSLFNITKCGRDILLDSRRLTRDLGEILDYEVPLNHASSRNIDLISARAKTLYILELKKCHSQETLLRCLLEAYTYSCLVDRSRLKESFGFGQDTSICICPLIFDESAAFEELKLITKSHKSEDGSTFFKLVNMLRNHENGELGIEFAVIETKKFKDFLAQNGCARDCDGKKFNEIWLE